MNNAGIQKRAMEWYVMARYVNWKGERKQKWAWLLPRKKHRNGANVPVAEPSDMDMSFGAFNKLYPGYEKPSEGEHMADKGTYHPHEDFTVFRQAENQRDFHKRGHCMAE